MHSGPCEKDHDNNQTEIEILKHSLHSFIEWSANARVTLYHYLIECK